MKLSNIRAVDPQANAAGHAHGSRQDNVFWRELKGDKKLLELELQRIRRTYPTCFRTITPLIEDGAGKSRSMPSSIEAPRRSEDNQKKVVREELNEAPVSELHHWIAAISDLQSTPWFRQICTYDPRFRWFMQHFQGYASPSAKHLTDILRRIAGTPGIARNKNSRIPELVTRLRDYCYFLHDLKLEDELFTVLSGVVDAKMVGPIAAELEWDGNVAQSSARRSRYTNNAIKEISRHTYWTPALNRALRILLKERIREVEDVIETLLAHEIIESSEFSPEGLREACRAFRRTMPHALRTK